VLVRYKPDGDAQMNRRQAGRLRRLSEWQRASGRKLMFVGRMSRPWLIGRPPLAE